MRVRMVVLVACLAAALAGSTVAASLAPQPGALVLRRSDFPATAKYSWGQMPASFSQGLGALGVKASGAFVAVTIPVGGSTKYQSVNGLVMTAASAGQARTAYAAFEEDLRGGSKSVLRFPAYGDQQLALYQSPKLGSKAELLVRRNRVVWQLELAGGGLLAIPRPALLAELQNYAAKQKQRVGSG